MEYYSDDAFSDERGGTETEERLSVIDKIVIASKIVDGLRDYIDFNGLNMLTSNNAVLDLIPIMDDI